MYCTDSISQGTGGVLVKWAEIHLYISPPIARSRNPALNNVLHRQYITGDRCSAVEIYRVTYRLLTAPIGKIFQETLPDYVLDRNTVYHRCTGGVAGVVLLKYSVTYRVLTAPIGKIFQEPLPDYVLDRNTVYHRCTGGVAGVLLLKYSESPIDCKLPL